ncbi:unnamed protein product [Thelazia callipaeda]|uniref:Major sperm protein n=1 Tax=Thelazia callipaeda TaxID=103827 RepID=A0A0N5CRG9_THECL|nr:unnamed protein product [Thelazia callipaeda]
MADAPPPEAAGAPPPDAAGGQAVLSIDPPVACVPASGGQSVHQVTNPTGLRLAFKVKSTNNNDYRLKPVYGIVEPSSATAIEITRSAGPPKEDKFVILFKEAPPNSDPATLFKDGTAIGEINLPVNAQ